MKGNGIMANNKKKKQKYGNPQKNIEAQKAAEAAAKEVEKAMMAQNNTSDKPLLLRIFVLAVAAVLLLGFVIATALGNM